ncbi:RNA polymerase sigma factor [Enterococcus sp. LJL120]
MGEKWIEELFEKEYPALLLYGISLTHSRFEAEDLVQEAFYRFLLIYDSLSSDNYRGWLFRVMRNYFYDGQRKEKNKKKLVKYLKKEYKGTTADLLEEFIQSNEREALFQKIQQLKNPYQEILLAYYFLEMPIQTIAEFLQLKPNNVKVLLHRGRKQLKERL